MKTSEMNNKLNEGINAIYLNSERVKNTLKELDLNNVNNRDDIPYWHTKDLVPKSNRTFWDLEPEQKRAYLLKREDKRREKEVKEFTEKLNYLLSDSREVERVVISVEWKKSSTWGANPKAKAEVYYSGNGYDYIEGKSVTGCGFDKLSESVAQVLNGIRPFRRELVRFDDNSEVYGFYPFKGSFLPHFMGGCGVNCYTGLFDAMGYNFRKVSNGKMFDVFEITRK